jgi:hypothetical protein
MYIMVECVYPSDKAKEVAKKYLKAMEKYPDDPNLATPTVLGAVRTTLQGISVIAIFEPKKGKFEEAYALAVNRMTMFQEIQGFEYEFKTRYTLEEAMKVIGM